MEFVRFVSRHRPADSQVHHGLFQAAFAARDHPETDSRTVAALRQELAWLEANLVAPKRFNRTRSKGFYRRLPKGISWFKATSEDHLRHAAELKRLVESCGWIITEIRERRVGYVIYEDKYQVVAEPFAETRTQ